MVTSSLDSIKKLNRIEKLARERSKQEKCLLCGRKISSYCNSHSIPRFVLKNISEQGFVNDLNLILEIPNKKTEIGIRGAGTFSIICDNCDREWFKEYENPDNLLNENFSNKILAEIALKNVTHMISKRNFEIELSKITDANLSNEILNVGINWKKWDIRDYKEKLEIYKKLICGDEKESFNIVYKEFLPYRTKIVAQSAIALKEYNGTQINDVFSDKETTKIQIMHICVFPLMNETLLLLFYHKADKKYKVVMHDFNSHNEQYRMDMLNYLILANIENFYFSPSIGDIFAKNNKLRDLCMEQHKLPILNKECLYHNIGDYTPVKYNEVPNLLSIK